MFHQRQIHLEMLTLSMKSSASYSSSTNLNEDADNRCCCKRGQIGSRDLTGQVVGCITGHRSEKRAKIVPLRGDINPLRKSQNCPIHGAFENDNDLDASGRFSNNSMENEPRIAYKDIIIIWNRSVESAKQKQWDDAYNTLHGIQNYSAKMRFNMGQIACVLQNLDLAKQNFMAAIEKDPHMALAHFQLGMVNFRLHRYNESRGSYDKARTCLRGNKFIDYRQLGFVHKLYECEILYNLALTYATMMNNSEYALELLHEASRVTVESRHAPMVENAQTQLLNNQLYEPFVLPTNQLFRPPQSKVENLNRRDYLGKAKIVSELPTTDSSNNNNKADFKPSPGSGFRPIDDDFSDDEDLASVGNNGSPTPSMMARMTHKDTIAVWHEGVQAFEKKGDVAEALTQLSEIVDPSAKILYGIGVLQAAMGQLNDALSSFEGVVSRDPHLGIGHFQLGVVRGLLEMYDDAWKAFDKAKDTLRGNKHIDYKQLGLHYKLHKCEILHNQAWTYHQLGEKDWARQLLDEALGCKAEARHEVFDESYRHFSDGYSFTLYQLPKPLLFKPPKSKTDNLDRKDYLGKAKIVAKLPSQRTGSSTPPPQSSSSLSVSVLPPRSRTPTPSSSGMRTSPVPLAPPVPRSSGATSPAPSRPLPSPVQIRKVSDSNPPWKMPVVTVAAVQGSASPGLPRRPLPSPTPGFNPNKALPKVPDFPDDSHSGLKPRGESAPSRPLPSPTRTSPPPERPLPQKPVESRLGGDGPPSRPLPSASRTSPVPDRPLPQKPSGDGPPVRPLPSPNRTSPVPDRPLPGPPRKTSSPELPQRPMPSVPKNSLSDILNRPLPTPGGSDRSSLANRPVPPPPSVDESYALARPKSSAVDLSSRPVPPSPFNSAPDLPSRPVSFAARNSASDMANRPVPALPKDGPPNDLPSRPVPPVPRTSVVEPPAPQLPSRPIPTKKTSTTAPAIDLPSRPVPPTPVTRTNEPELPARPPSKPLASPRQASPLPDRPPPGGSSSSSSKTNFRDERRPSSPGLPDLPPPPPPQRGPSPVPNQAPAGDKKSASGHKARLVHIKQDSPPVLRRAAAITVQTEDKDKPSRPVPGQNDNKPASTGNNSVPAWKKPPASENKQVPAWKKPSASENKPASAGNQSVPAWKKPAAGENKPAGAGNQTVPAWKKPAASENKPAPAWKKPAASENKPVGAGNQPPVLAFRPQLKPTGGSGGGAGKRKTALVMASHTADGDGEVSVSEGDLITIVGEDGNWLKIEFKGQKGRVPRSCVKNYHKPDISL